MLSKDNHMKIIDFGTCGFSSKLSKELYEKISSIRKKFPDETDPSESDD